MIQDKELWVVLGMINPLFPLLLPSLHAVIPSLLLPLASPHQLIRERALDCLQTLQEACSPLYPVPDPSHDNTLNSCPLPALQLVHDIMRCRPEIAVDSSYVLHILSRSCTPSMPLSSSSLAPPSPATPTHGRRKSRRVELARGVRSVVGAAGWLECVLVHIVSLGMPAYVQHQFLQILQRVDHIVSCNSSGWPSGTGC